jgi:hypothetical protein
MDDMIIHGVEPGSLTVCVQTRRPFYIQRTEYSIVLTVVVVVVVAAALERAPRPSLLLHEALLEPPAG